MKRGAYGKIDLDQVGMWLEAGWQIEEPVVQRSVYYTVAGRVSAFELVLHCRDQRRVVALEAVPAVQAFLRQHALAVLELA